MKVVYTRPQIEAINLLTKELLLDLRLEKISISQSTGQGKDKAISQKLFTDTITDLEDIISGFAADLTALTGVVGDVDTALTIINGDV